MLGKSAEIAELQKQNSDLTAAKTKLETENTDLKGRTETAEKERDEAKASLASEKARADKADADLKAANEKAAADLKAADEKHAGALKAAEEAHEKKVAEQVTSRLAAAGGDPLAKDPAAKKAGEPGQADTTGLTGRERLAAAFKSQLADKGK